MLSPAVDCGPEAQEDDEMKKVSTKKATNKVEDLPVKDDAKVAGGLSLNFTKVEYKYVPYNA